ncbi:MAG TPA: hypothetical protein VGL02_29390 [Streptomyces sp.]
MAAPWVQLLPQSGTHPEPSRWAPAVALTEDSAAIAVFVVEPAQRAPQHIQAPIASMTVECS